MTKKSSLLLSIFLIFLFVIPSLSSSDQDDEVVSVGVGAEGEQKQEKKRREPIVRYKQQRAESPQSQAAGIKIKNPRSYPIDYYWWSGTTTIYQGKIHPRGVTATNSYIGHTFLFTKQMRPQPNNPLEYEFYRITVKKNINLYILPPEDGQENDPLYLKMMEEKKFTEEYLERTGMISLL